MKPKSNTIMILLYLVLIIFFLIQLYDLYNIEKFTTHETFIQNSNINSLVVSPETNNNNIDTYYGTFVTNNNNDSKNGCFIYKTNALDDNKWEKSELPKLELNKNIIVNNIMYNENKKMMAIGIYYKNNKSVYNIYIESTDNSNIVWKKLGSDINIRSICFDSLTYKLLGVSSHDGQIYEKRIDTSTYEKNDWIGPVNNDIPMSKIMYDKDNIMIGIGLFDNYIYTKQGVNWRTEYWDKKKINKTKVNDLLYDYDGCLIGSSNKGLFKQLKPELSSEFVNITKYIKNKNTSILTKYDILKSKIGYEYLDDIFDTDTSLGRHLKNIYEIKKKTKHMCYNKELLRPRSNFENDTDELSFKNREINDLYTEIDKINKHLSK